MPDSGTQATRASPSRRAAAGLIIMLIATTTLSQFFRSALAVIAPELIRDLALSPRMLGAANGGFFAALLVAQVGVGVLFDRVGARLTVALLALPMALGAGLHALAFSGETLVAARFVTGIGCAASFMSTLVLVSRWYPRARWSTALSWVYGTSQLGVLAAGTPFAVVVEAIGWRLAFALMGLVAASVGVLFYLIVRDAPAGERADIQRAPEPIGALDGLARVIALPGVPYVFAMFAVAYAATFTVSGLWAGPYLADVHGLDAIARGHVLTGMAAVQTLAILLIGPLDGVFNTRKWVVATGAAISLAVLTTLATVPDLPFAAAVALLVALCTASGYSTVLLAHIRSHFPDALAGRGVTTANIAQLAGSAALPVLAGSVLGAMTPAIATHAIAGAGGAEAGYRAMFAMLALALGVGLAFYLRSTDHRPRPDGA